MAADEKPSQEIVDLHSDMVKELAGKFSVKGKAWRGICNQISRRDILSNSDLGDVDTMDELFIMLMKREKINYGDCETIRKILHDQDVDAKRIINNYTERIKRALNKKGKRKDGQDLDSETLKEERRLKGNKGKRKHSTDTDTDTEVKHRESKQRKGKRRFSSDSDSKADNEGRQSTHKRGCLYQSRDADSGTGADGRESSRKARNAGNLRKVHDDTHSAKIVYTWKKAMDAVGFIEGPASSGTGFRVGKDKIMTAYHVVQDITRPRKDDKSHLSNLKKDSVSITFNFLEKNDQKDTRKFHFTKLCAHDSDMDFAILQLKKNDEDEEPSYPKEIKRFKRVSADQTFALLGHPSEKPMQLDPKVQIVDPNSDQGRKQLEDMETWWHKKYKQVAHENILDENKVLFDCWIQHGASGSQGIEMDSDGEPVCSLMLLCGYPGSALDGEYIIKREDHPYMIEQGVTMKAIAEFLDTMDQTELRHEIFADSSFK